MNEHAIMVLIYSVMVLVDGDSCSAETIENHKAWDLRHTNDAMQPLAWVHTKLFI